MQSPELSRSPKDCRRLGLRASPTATGSTTGRGLYLGMTRGRQANHGLVVTDTNDLGAARDLLEE